MRLQCAHFVHLHTFLALFISKMEWTNFYSQSISHLRSLSLFLFFPPYLPTSPLSLSLSLFRCRVSFSLCVFACLKSNYQQLIYFNSNRSHFWLFKTKKRINTFSLTCSATLDLFIYKYIERVDGISKPSKYSQFTVYAMRHAQITCTTSPLTMA